MSELACCSIISCSQLLLKCIVILLIAERNEFMELTVVVNCLVNELHANTQADNYHKLRSDSFYQYRLHTIFSSTQICAVQLPFALQELYDLLKFSIKWPAWKDLFM